MLLELLATVLCLLLAILVYRLTLHPLAKFPGPKVAAATSLYRAYYDVVKDGGGEMLHQLEYLHSAYGTSSVQFYAGNFD